MKTLLISNQFYWRYVTQNAKVSFYQLLSCPPIEPFWGNTCVCLARSGRLHCASVCFLGVRRLCGARGRGREQDCTSKGRITSRREEGASREMLLLLLHKNSLDDDDDKDKDKDKDKTKTMTKTKQIPRQIQRAKGGLRAEGRREPPGRYYCCCYCTKILLMMTMTKTKTRQRRWQRR